MKNSKKIIFPSSSVQSTIDSEMCYYGTRANDFFQDAKFYRKCKQYGQAADCKAMGRCYLKQFFKLKNYIIKNYSTYR